MTRGLEGLSIVQSLLYGLAALVVAFLKAWGWERAKDQEEGRKAERSKAERARRSARRKTGR
jgi:hypothetical protein